MQKLRLVLDTYASNFSFTQWPRTVLEPFEEVAAIVDHLYTQKTIIRADPHLSDLGKEAARLSAGKAALEKIDRWQTRRLAGLDGDIGARRAALLPVSTEKPDDRKIDFLLSHLRDKTPLEISVFYNSATDEERLLMEGAAASVGRVPMKTERGLEWQPLLNPETVNDSIVARATARNPEGAKQLVELAEIRAMHVSVAGIAAAEVEEVPGYKPDEEGENIKTFTNPLGEGAPHF